MGISAKRLFGIIVLIAGLGILINAISNYGREVEFEKNSETTTATVTKVYKNNRKGIDKWKKYYTANVTYKVDGKVYENVKLDRRTTSVYNGSTVEILYNKNNPTDIRRKSSFNPERKIYTSVVVIVIGMVFIGISFLENKGKKKGKFKASKRAELKNTGIKYEAKVTKVFHDTRNKLKGQYPYIVECSVTNPQTGKEEKFRSIYIIRDLSSVDLQTVNVYVSKENPAFYYVDVEGTLDGN